MTGKHNRPGVGPRPAAKSSCATEPTLPDVARCCACRHPLTASKSLSRGFGPECWRRVRAAQALDRAEAVRVRLDALAGRVAVLDARGLALVADRLADLEDALDAGVRRG